jgi:hypothetical protein
MQVTRISPNYNNQNKTSFKGSTIIKQSLNSLPEKAIETISLMTNKIIDSSDYHTLCVTSDNETEQKFLQILRANNIKNTHLKFDILEGLSSEKLEKFFIKLRTPETPKPPDKIIYA